MSPKAHELKAWSPVQQCPEVGLLGRDGFRGSDLLSRLAHRWSHLNGPSGGGGSCRRKWVTGRPGGVRLVPGASLSLSFLDTMKGAALLPREPLPVRCLATGPEMMAPLTMD